MPYLLRKSVLLIAALFIVAIVSKDVLAEPLIKSKYFSVYADGGIDKVDLLKKLNAGYFLRLGAAFSENAGHGEDLDGMVASTLDAIYLEVSDILDIHMYDLNIDLEILPDRAALASFRDRLAGWWMKALREGKLRSGWAAPNADYEARAKAFGFAPVLAPKAAA